MGSRGGFSKEPLAAGDSKGYKSISYAKITAVLVESIKELDTKYKEKIASLEKENRMLKNKISSLESINDRLATLEKAIKTNIYSKK